MPKKPISPRAKRFWQRLAEWYGSRLAEQYGEDPPPDWCEIIDRSDNEAVKRGLSIIRSKYLQHPPTFPQFDELMAPAKAAQGVQGPSTAERLCAYAAKNYWYMLTPKQQRGPWNYLRKSFAASNNGGKMIEAHGVDITGIVIDPDGEAQGYRIMLADMQVASTDWGHPDPPGVRDA